MRGAFRFFAGTPDEVVLPNNLIAEGEKDFLKMIFNDDHSVVAGGGSFYLGLMGATFDKVTSTLATITGEPSAAGGYARISITRDATGFPTFTQVNGVWKAVSKQVSFTATGADFSVSWSRVFLCTVASGTSGHLLSVSNAYTTPITILNGVSFPIVYEFYAN